MNDEAARQGRSDNSPDRFVQSIGGSDAELSIEEIVEAVPRAVARACGLSWVHDLVREEIRRLAERCAA